MPVLLSSGKTWSAPTTKDASRRQGQQEHSWIDLLSPTNLRPCVGQATSSQPSPSVLCNNVKSLKWTVGCLDSQSAATLVLGGKAAEPNQNKCLSSLGSFLRNARTLTRTCLICSLEGGRTPLL